MKYIQRADGEGFTVKSGHIHRIACCDCGLVHDIVLCHKNGGLIGMAAQRNTRATAQKRRKGKMAYNRNARKAWTAEDIKRLQRLTREGTPGWRDRPQTRAERCRNKTKEEG